MAGESLEAQRKAAETQAAKTWLTIYGSACALVLASIAGGAVLLVMSEAVKDDIINDNPCPEGECYEGTALVNADLNIYNPYRCNVKGCCHKGGKTECNEVDMSQVDSYTYGGGAMLAFGGLVLLILLSRFNSGRKYARVYSSRHVNTGLEL